MYPNYTQKVYSVVDNIIYDGVEIEKHTLKKGVTINCVKLGEEGPGRNLGIIPINRLPEGCHFIKFAEKGENKSLYFKEEKDYINSSYKDSALVFIKPSISTKQFVEISSGNLGYKGYYGRLACAIHMGGRIAQGEAGRNGWAVQLLIDMPKNYIVRVARYGKLTRQQHAEIFYVWDGEKIKYPSNVEELL
jgi:hypothetical protein